MIIILIPPWIIWQESFNLYLMIYLKTQKLDLIKIELTSIKAISSHLVSFKVCSKSKITSIDQLRQSSILLLKNQPPNPSMNHFHTMKIISSGLLIY